MAFSRYPTELACAKKLVDAQTVRTGARCRSATNAPPNIRPYTRCPTRLPTATMRICGIINGANGDMPIDNGIRTRPPRIHQANP